ncbi:hypothetical protein CH302_27620 [Rhodococcus sp. 15-2388-1-1a]|uniref:hypothetical protein n=1 Tax=Rhodococcus sp. 15-2388-1-1a TaxID=2023142 RepID=UPI000B9BE985|nr:hypothetical protein [Rhodococcus sp. 15-2388-1-1a]OZE90222.1 hypothetical protein CH302_27620 [Rhodococcus sp. 15-2388-1-1a]
MDLNVKREDFGQDDRSWLATAHGTETARPINIDVASFAGKYPDGWIKSGYPLKKIGTRYGLRVDGDTDPIEGHLYTAVKVPAGLAVVAGALYWHGAVLTAKLPQSVNAAGQATARDIRYF